MSVCVRFLYWLFCRRCSLMKFDRERFFKIYKKFKDDEEHLKKMKEKRRRKVIGLMASKKLKS